MCPNGTLSNGGTGQTQGNGNDFEDPEVLPTLSKLSAVHNLISIFDSESAVTPEYFVTSFDRLADSLKAGDPEKLLIMKTRIRGPALTHIIQSPEMANETSYKEFKTKFLNFFETKSSVALRSQQFSNCKMLPAEPIKLFAARVATATLKFLGKVNVKDDAIVSIIEQTKLSKFLEGVKPDIRKNLLTKDPKSFDEAVAFAELLELNDSMSQGDNAESLNAINRQPNYSEMIERHAQQMHELVSSLSREFKEFKLAQQNSDREGLSDRNYTQREQWNRTNGQMGNNMFCTRCLKTNHRNDQCFFRNENTNSNFRNFQGGSRGRPQSRGQFRNSQDWRGDQRAHERNTSGENDRRAATNDRWGGTRNRSPAPTRYNQSQRTPEKNVRFSENARGTRL